MYVHNEYAGKDGVPTIDRHDASSEEKEKKMVVSREGPREV
jgi:hypothetical protein